MTYSLVPLTQYHIPEAETFNLLGANGKTAELQIVLKITFLFIICTYFNLNVRMSGNSIFFLHRRKRRKSKTRREREDTFRRKASCSH
jgi:hypothetical protein